METSILMTLRGLIFDLDGTLADTVPICIAAFREAVEALQGRRYTDEEVTALFGPSEAGMLRQALPDQWQDAVEAYLDAYSRAHVSCREVFPGVLAILNELRTRGILLAVVTGKGPRSAEISLRHLGLISYFDIVEAGSPDGSIKPAAIRRVLTHWRVAPCAVAYVGDTPSDTDAAAEVGVQGVGAAWAGTAPLRHTTHASATAVFTSVEAFATWVTDHT